MEVMEFDVPVLGQENNFVDDRINHTSVAPNVNEGMFSCFPGIF